MHGTIDRVSFKMKKDATVWVSECGIIYAHPLAPKAHCALAQTMEPLNEN